MRAGCRLFGSGPAALRLAVLGCGLLLGSLSAGGCREAPAPVEVLDWEVEPDPPRVGPATFSFTLVDPAGAPVEDAQVQLEGNMSHPGMRPVPARAAEVAPGRYTAPLAFTMGGDWIVLLHVTLPDGRTVQRQVDVQGVRSE